MTLIETKILEFKKDLPKMHWHTKYAGDRSQLKNPVMEEWLKSALEEVERKTQIEALEWIRVNTSGSGDYRRKIAMKLSQLKQK